MMKFFAGGSVEIQLLDTGLVYPNQIAVQLQMYLGENEIGFGSVEARA